MLDTIEIPVDLFQFRLPETVQARLQYLLDRQRAGEALTTEERKEAEELAQLAEFLALLDLSAKRRRLMRARPAFPRSPAAGRAGNERYR